MADLRPGLAGVVMGLAISTLCQLGTADERTVAFVRSLWLGYIKNTVQERSTYKAKVAELEARLRRQSARRSRTSARITTGGRAPRRHLATRAVRQGAADPFSSDSDSETDDSDRPVDIEIASGWAAHVPDFGVIVMFIRFMKKSVEQMGLERAIMDACDDLEQEHRVST